MLCLSTHLSCSSLIRRVSSSDACMSSALDLLEPFLSILSPGRSSLRCFPNLSKSEGRRRFNCNTGLIFSKPIWTFFFFFSCSGMSLPLFWKFRWNPPKEIKVSNCQNLQAGFVLGRQRRRPLPRYSFVIERITWQFSYKCNQNASNHIKR